MSQHWVQRSDRFSKLPYYPNYFHILPNLLNCSLREPSLQTNCFCHAFLEDPLKGQAVFHLFGIKDNTFGAILSLSTLKSTKKMVVRSFMLVIQLVIYRELSL